MSCSKINKMCELNVSLETLREQADSHCIHSVALSPHPPQHVDVPSLLFIGEREL